MTDALVFPFYEDNQGKVHEASPAILAALEEALGTNAATDGNAPSKRAWQPKDGLRQTGLAVQLYALRRTGDWGIGDFTSLSMATRWGEQVGLDYIGVSPLHALSLSAPEAISPYYPSSRLALNPLYIDVEAIADRLGLPLALAPETEQHLKRTRALDLVDYEAVNRAKVGSLKSLFGAVDTGGRLRDFRAEAPPRLLAHALHEAHRSLTGETPKFRCGSEEAAAFAGRHREEVDFHLFLQWAAGVQLDEAVAAGGKACSLYLDLAVGAAPDGSEVWSQPEDYIPSVRLGAPPDMMAPGGQDWGLVPLHPAQVTRREGEPFAAILEASAKYAGALRIDHALGLARQYFIPANASAAEATYVRFPLNTLLRTIAEVSTANTCLMIGEDLGTVPEGLTDALHRSGILSYEVTRWARNEDGAFLQAADYPKDCLAAATTHDIAPIAGWLSGSDLETRAEIGHLPGDRGKLEREGREEEKAGLLRLWKVEQEDPNPDHVVRAAHRFLAKSRAGVVMMALEDLLLQEEMMNLPGTMDEYPNWCRSYRMPIEEWSQNEQVLTRLRAGLR